MTGVQTCALPICLAELQGGLRIGVDEHFLDRGAFGPVLSNQRLQLPLQLNQPLGERLLAVGPDLPVGDVAQPVPFRRDDAPAGAAEPRVEAEDQRQESRSITSSGTS